jgi:protein-L-isoaspartate(D-aspartate) O-methyltransferase
MSGVRDNYFRLLGDAVGEATMEAIRRVDREKFFDPMFKDRLYSMERIPIGAGQKSDDPRIMARMADLLGLRKEWRVLEVGTGSGYSTAVLSQMAGEVVTVEYVEALALGARERMAGNGHAVRFFCGDATDFEGNLGEFDAAVVFAACIRTPYSIITMLRPGGTAVFPMGPAHQQQITRFVNELGAADMSKNFSFFDLCEFDSIRGAYGWIDAPEAPPEESPGENPEKEGGKP